MDFTPLLEEFRRFDHKYRNILLKRYFYRAAGRLARSIKAETFVTGEALGQVSSQTTSNLQTISTATDCFVFQPIIGLDKSEVMDIARRIGTYDISRRVPEFCNVAVRHPRTRSRPAELVFYENQIAPEILDSIIRNAVREDLKSMPAMERPAGTELRAVPANARFIWISDDNAKESIPPGVHNIVPSTEIRSFFKNFTWDGPVVVGCRKGLLSRDTAAYLREQGVESYHLA